MPSGLVIGTAGHIDHGKTSLVGALTGMDTDRLAEEKRRGISIDLGFAHVALANGRRLSFVDVPGHERFVRNMLAGAAGIEAVMLVIAADESVKPQTREHFAICRLLNVRRGLIVLSKADLASPEQMAKASAEARQLVAGSFLEGAPLVAASAVSGEGLDELKEVLDGIASEATRRDAAGFVRLPVDRSFALRGFGTVVTGTLWSGTLRVGENVQLHPGGSVARVRGLQRHGEGVASAVAGDRTAVNLAGVDHNDIKRGFMLTSVDSLEGSSTLDVSLEWLDTAPSKPTEFLLDIGTTEVVARLRILKAGHPFARLRLSEPVVALPGDRFVLRRPSPTLTVAGGVVIDAFPPKRMNRAKTFERLSRLATATPGERLALLTSESANGLTVKDSIRLTGAAAVETPDVVLIANGQHLVSKRWLVERRARLIEWLSAFHAKNAGAAGAPFAQARLGLSPALMNAVMDGFSAVKVYGDLICLATHQARLTPAESQTLSDVELAFRQGEFQPPAPGEVLARVKGDTRGLLESLIKAKKLVRLAPDMIFHADVIAHVRQSLAAHKGRKFSVQEFKSWTNISRKYAIPLLEYLDQQHVTRRDGDMRVVL